MQNNERKYIFPSVEQELYGSRKVWYSCLAVMTVSCLPAMVIFAYQETFEGCIFLGILLLGCFLLVHYRAPIMIKWSTACWRFDGNAFYNCIGDETRTVTVAETFCVCTVRLAFGRPKARPVQFPFILVWKPGQTVPYDEMMAFSALKSREALILPDNDETREIMKRILNIEKLPKHPKALVHQGNRIEMKN